MNRSTKETNNQESVTDIHGLLNKSVGLLVQHNT